MVKKNADANVRIYIMEKEGIPVGQVRMDRIERKVKISYALCEEVRRCGLAKWMLEELEKQLRIEDFCGQIVAEVKLENLVSQKIFDFLAIRKKKWSMAIIIIRISHYSAL